MTRTAPHASLALRAIALRADGGLAHEIIEVLRHRGYAAAISRDPRSADLGPDVVWAWAMPVTLDAAELGAMLPSVRRAALAGRPPVCLVPPALLRTQGLADAAALASLRAHGAVLCHDPDIWIEAMIITTSGVLPAGPRLAIIADEHSLMACQADALEAEATALGARVADATASGVDAQGQPNGATDVVLVDAALPDLADALRGAPAAFAVVARPELDTASLPRPLHGLRAAMGAVLAVGRARERAAHGFGPAPELARAELLRDADRWHRQVGKLGAWDRRLGDHESKVLLAAYGVPVIRQAVATTPSAAIRIAKQAGFPVELKAWGPEVPSELDGTVVERAVGNASDVRRAYAALTGDPSPTAEAAVIVRETPPSGREVRVAVHAIGALGWFVAVWPFAGAAPHLAPAPLTPLDARALAASLPTGRGGDAEPDRDALAEALRGISFAATGLGDRLAELRVGRLIVARSRVVVVDAEILLSTRPS